MEVSFRRTRTTQSNIGAISSWLRLGEIEAEKMETPKYNKTKFEKSLSLIRELTIQTPEIIESEIRRLCHEAGITFVIVPSISGAHVSGVARWLNHHRPLIQLSLYGKTNDKFWFTFFHEAAHILLHSNEKKTIFLDDLDGDIQHSKEEQEANNWASEFLIPSIYNARLIGLKSKESVINFSQEIGIHTGIIVGRLQHEKIIDFSMMNDLKIRYNH